VLSFDELVSMPFTFCAENCGCGYYVLVYSRNAFAAVAEYHYSLKCFPDLQTHIHTYQQLRVHGTVPSLSSTFSCAHVL